MPEPNSSAPLVARPPARTRSAPPSQTEERYVSWLFHSKVKDAIFNDDDTISNDKDATSNNPESDAKIARPLNVKAEKFSELGDIRTGKFYDLVGQIVKQPYGSLDRVTIWLTDYTENDAFFHFTWSGATEDVGITDDQDGYADRFTAPSSSGSEWPGPFGKRAMQITCYEPHATFIRKGVDAGDWVELRNVQIKLGANAANLEGFLREDRHAFHKKINVKVLTPDRENPDDRLKQALYRKRAYEKQKKQEKQELDEIRDDSSGGLKRKVDASGPQKEGAAKQRRKANRAAKQKQMMEKDAKIQEMMNLNEHGKPPVVCFSLLSQNPTHELNSEVRVRR